MLYVHTAHICWLNQNQIDLENSIVINMRARARAKYELVLTGTYTVNVKSDIWFFLLTYIWLHEQTLLAIISYKYEYEYGASLCMGDYVIGIKLSRLFRGCFIELWGVIRECRLTWVCRSTFTYSITIVVFHNNSIYWMLRSVFFPEVMHEWECFAIEVRKIQINN